MHLILLLAAAAPLASPPAGDEIVVTASREPVAAGSAAVPSTVVKEELDGPGAALGQPMAADLIRLTPGVSVAQGGPRGTQTQVRIRGAEANHTLLFVDGIRFNDPAAGNEARFELLASDMLRRIDIVRGSHSALWGSEAIGGIVDAHTVEATEGGRPFQALGEYGGLDSVHASALAAATPGRLRLSGGGAWMKSGGIDSFGAGGERDGFDHVSGTLKALFDPSQDVTIGVVGHWIVGESEFDGLDPVTFRRADTLDETSSRIGAARAWLEAERSGWKLTLDASLLDSVNRNRLGAMPLNSTSGRRFAGGGQVSRTLGGHRFTVALEHQQEDFRARDRQFFGATDQDRERELTAIVGEWRGQWNDVLATEFALRHDRFSAFADSTTIRAGIVVRPIRRLNLFAAYGEGIAQPTFYDLFGFFPGSFTGNPDLRPEGSRAWHAGVRWNSGGRLFLGLGGFTARLEDEIVDVFDPVTFRSTTANATGTSRRRGIEAEAELRLSDAFNLMVNYTLLDAEEQQVAGGLALKEIRRARHSFNLLGHGLAGRFSWGASLAYVGRRGDTDFDFFPGRAVILDDYVLASARIGWRLSQGLEAFVRAENLFDADYQDVIGYNTPGRTVHAGLRLRLRD